jgi:hypothetical protein
MWRSGRYAAGTATAESSSGGWEVSLFRETKAAFQGSWPTIGSSSSSFEGGGERTPQTPDGGCSGARLLKHPPPGLHPPSLRRGSRESVHTAYKYGWPGQGRGQRSGAVRRPPTGLEMDPARHGRCPLG